MQSATAPRAKFTMPMHSTVRRRRRRSRRRRRHRLAPIARPQTQHSAGTAAEADAAEAHTAAAETAVAALPAAAALA